jgi:cytochrome c-type biogenesis protein CcmF
MTAEIGHFALILALVVSFVQVIAPLWGAARGDSTLMALGRTAAVLLAGMVILAFGALAACYMTKDFSVALVAEHSHSTQPLVYRFAATWGSHEGSMLLWVLILAIYGAGVALFGRSLRETLQARVIGVQGLIACAFLGFLLFTSNPFLRLSPAPLEGNELNPLLQDPGLVFHPPMLYLGYVGFSVAFAFAIAALIEGRVDAGWARWVRPWVLSAWICLTVGITFGSLWAYYELGWGGWWFWDPVENASLMPWLMGTALLHSSLALERRGALVSWTILLAIMTFTFSLIGTFLVRSGVLTSVHAFAVDPKRGVYILAIIALTTGTALGLYAWRAPALKSGALFSFLSREVGLVANNVLLLFATTVVFLGTFYPVFLSILNGDTISVGPPFYHLAFTPAALTLLPLVVFGAMLNWKRDALRPLLGRLRWPLIAAAVALVGAVALAGVDSIGKIACGIGIGIGVLLILGSAAVVVRRWRNEVSLGASTSRLIRSTPLAVWGLVLAHTGLGVTAIGVSAVSAWQTNKVLMMAPGQSTTIAGRTVMLDALQPATGVNYEARQGRFLVTDPMGGTHVLTAERRFYPSSQTQTTEAAIGSSIFGNTYVAIGDPGANGTVVVRLWRHPFVGWIWGGGLIMALGGLISLSDRRWRLGVAQRATAPVTDAAAIGKPA